MRIIFLNIHSNLQYSKFEDTKMETTVQNINATNSKVDDKFVIQSFETINSKDDEETFGILINIRQVLFKDSTLEWLHHHNKIAVPKGHNNLVKLTAPSRPPNKTNIDVKMFSVEVIDIDVKLQQFTIRMDLEINWSEKRLLLRNSHLVNGWIQTKPSLVWSPQIAIRSVVSESRSEKLLEVKMDSQSVISEWNWYNKYLIHLRQSFSAKMTTSLNMTVKCSMELEMFPSETHICKLEVSFIIRI